MNKELEALRRLHYGAQLYCDKLLENKIINENHCRDNIVLYLKRIERIDKDYDLLKQALKRNEPMKVDLETGTWVNYVEYYRCPNCTGRAVEIWHRFCPDCGQALDGSDDE